jgi:hypothetical protein
VNHSVFKIVQRFAALQVARLQLCRCTHLPDDESAQSKNALAASTQGLMSQTHSKAKGAHGEVLVPPRAEV